MFPSLAISAVNVCKIEADPALFCGFDEALVVERDGQILRSTRRLTYCPITYERTLIDSFTLTQAKDLRIGFIGAGQINFGAFEGQKSEV